MSPGVAPPPSGCVALVVALLLRLIGSGAHGMDTSFQVGHDAIGVHEDALSTEDEALEQFLPLEIESNWSTEPHLQTLSRVK
uniref:Putative secreted protein n=1 Tax=Anopheles darlingi TaxID=43151 RepID=A0A2M4DNA5_ANODA